MKTSNKSLNFLSERGNDNYYENELITINIPAGSAPLINTQDSYLSFSLEMGRDGQENGAFVVPDSKLSSLPFSQIQIFDGNQATLLEEMSGIDIWHVMSNYYGKNSNDINLQNVFEARTKEFNPEYVTANNREYPVTTAGSRTNLSRGGGFGSSFYSLNDTAMNTDGKRKAQIIYNFPMSGLLSSLKKELLSPIVLNGLTLKIRMISGAKFLRLQKINVVPENNADPVSIGYADINETTLAQRFLTNDTAVGGTFVYNSTINKYTMAGWVSDAAGSVEAGDTTGADIYGIVLSATEVTGYKITELKNCSIKIGSYVGLGIETPTVAGDVTKVTSRVSKVEVRGDGKIQITFATPWTPIGAFLPNTSPVCCDVSDLRSDYTVSDVQYVANVVETSPDYILKMIKQASSGKLLINYNSYSDNRINMVTGSTSNDIFIPTDLQDCYAILGVPEKLGTHSVLRSDFVAPILNLRDYSWIFDGNVVPNLPIDLQRLSRGQVSALQIIELEKAFDETSIEVKNIQNPSNCFVLGRRLSAYGNTVSLLGKTIKCRINYSNDQPNNILMHFFIYHAKTISFDGNLRVVEQ